MAVHRANMAIISAKNLKKSFVKVNFNWHDIFHLERKETEAVKGLSLEIEEGEFVGFLGPNGAGKTTFLKMLSGIIYPTDGTAKVLGYVPWERDYRLLGKISIVMGQKNQLWWDLPAIDSFNLLKEIYGVSERNYKKNLDMMAEVLNIKDLLGKRLRNMSLGERMKCELTASFLHDPKVIFLDEPTIGLDVVSSQSIRTFLKTINKEKKCTLILTSHYMGDIEELCKRVVIINKGSKIYDGLLSELISKYAAEKTVTIYLPTLEDRKKFAQIKADKKIEEQNGIIRSSNKEISEVVKQVFDQFPAENISISDPSAEEVITKIFQQKHVEIKNY